MFKERYEGEEKDFTKGFWVSALFSIAGFVVLGYYEDWKLIALAVAIIFGVEYWNLKREYRKRFFSDRSSGE